MMTDPLFSCGHCILFSVSFSRRHRPVNEREARRLLDARVASGKRLVEVQRGELRTIKQLQSRCHAAGVPTVLGPGSRGG
jgi:hypothetical protein